MKVVISSGHGAKVGGASGPEPWGLEEHPEAVRVVDRTAEFLRGAGIEVVTYEDMTSTNQDQNLKNLVDFHNSQTRDLDVSVHFNHNGDTASPRGTECWYYSQVDLAEEVAASIAIASGLIDRGPKQSTGLYFLNHTEEPAILIEVCFVNSEADVRAYDGHFDQICAAIAGAIAGEEIGTEPPTPENVLFVARGPCSYFGGPEDTGVSASEGLAFLYEVGDAPHLFLPDQPPGTTGLARRLNPQLFYVACRWDYGVTSKEMLARPNYQALVRSGDLEFLAWPADWGPNENTGRVADLSPALMDALGLETDDEVEVFYPAP